MVKQLFESRIALEFGDCMAWDMTVLLMTRLKQTECAVHDFQRIFFSDNLETIKCLRVHWYSFVIFMFSDHLGCK